MAGVAYAVVREDPPRVFLAETIEVLERVLAVELVGRTDPGFVDGPRRVALRQALTEERWADAVLEWIELSDTPVDVYTYLPVYSDAEFPPGLVGAQLQFAPLFRD